MIRAALRYRGLAASIRPRMGKSPSRRRHSMKRTAVGAGLGVGCVVVVASLAAGRSGPGGQRAIAEQCSLVVVSRLVDRGEKVCDTEVVQQMASQGQAFAQNQLGIASILAIG